jgi:uncharacterized protein YfaS (alpha-2-macroglobulin family)
MAKQRYYRGDTLGKVFTFKNESGNLFDPTTISIAIKKPDGTTAATKTMADLTQTGTGTYKLLYNIPSDAPYGMWKLAATATYSVGNLQNTEEFTFIVESE